MRKIGLPTLVVMMAMLVVIFFAALNLISKIESCEEINHQQEEQIIALEEQLEFELKTEEKHDLSVYIWDSYQLRAKNRLRFEPEAVEVEEFLNLESNGDNQVELLYRFEETPVLIGLDNEPIYPNAIQGETIHLSVNNVGLMVYSVCPTNRSYCRYEIVETHYFPFPP